MLTVSHTSALPDTLPVLTLRLQGNSTRWARVSDVSAATDFSSNSFCCFHHVNKLHVTPLRPSPGPGPGSAGAEVQLCLLSAAGL